MFVVDEIVFFLTLDLNMVLSSKFTNCITFFVSLPAMFYQWAIGNAQIDTFYNYGQHYGPGSPCTSG